MTEETQAGTPKAAAPVSAAGAAQKAEQAVHAVQEKAGQVVQAAEEKTADAVRQTQQAAQTAEQKMEAATAKAQEVGKKLTGFLGGLAEKAKKLDMKELAEKAKNIDVKDLTEKAKQKVNEVKDMAGDITSGKTENFAQPREDVPADQMKELMQKMADQAAEALPPAAEAVLADLTAGSEHAELKIRFGAASEPSYVVLTPRSLIHFAKASDQFSASIYPLSSVLGYSLVPPRTETSGRFVVFTKTGEVKLALPSIEIYCKALILYRKLRHQSEG